MDAMAKRTKTRSKHAGIGVAAMRRPQEPGPAGVGPERGAAQSLAWGVWDTPERVIAHPDAGNGTGDSAPRLLLMPLADGSLRITATRRPLTAIRTTAGIARMRHTWVKSVLMSEPRYGVDRATETLSKRLALAGFRNVGGRLFEAVTVEAVAPILRDIYPDMGALPQEPVEPQIPPFLKKENPVLNDESAQASQLPSLVVASTAIRRDREGRYCLNDLHKAAGGEAKHQPAFFMRRLETTELIEEIVSSANSQSLDTSQTGNLQTLQPVASIKGKGKEQGTYVCKELVYAYAMWISPKFNLAVIRAFDAMVTNKAPEIGLSGVHPEIARAARMTAWRIANEMREAYLGAMGSARRPEDEERAWEMFSVLMERIEEHLRVMCREMSRKHDHQSVAAWIMAWRPAAKAQAVNA